MALYQPTQIVPSTLSGLGDGVIDVTDELVVSWQINGFSAMNAYKIVIYKNDTASTQMLDTGKVTLLNPVYGTDQNGEQILFNANPISAAALSSAGIVNGYSNGYKLIITQYWGISDSIEQTSASVFLTRAKPTVTMGAIPSPLASKELSVSATYSQAQGDTLSWVRWILTDYSGNILRDTGRVSTGVLQFDYDGLFSGSSYYIECLIETENGVTATTGKVNFDVSYSMDPSEGLVNLCRRAGQPYVEVSWSDRSAIEGEATGTYSVSGGLLRLPMGSSVTWDNVDGVPISFVKPWSMAWRGQIPNPMDNGGINSVISNIEPIQDLHGYANPWPAGGGKNLANYNTDYVPTVGVNNGIVSLFAFTLPAGTYTFSCKQSVTVPTSTRNTLVVTVGSGSYQYENTGGNYNPTNLRHEKTFTVTEESNCVFWIWSHSPSVAATYSEWQVEESSAFTGYAPYSNICPISGRTGANVYHTGKNLLEMYGVSENGKNYLSKNIFAKAGSYTLSAIGISGNYATYVREAGTEGSYAGTVVAEKSNQGNLTFSLAKDTAIMVQWYAPNDSSATLTGKTFQLELGSTASNYSAYSGTTIPVMWQSEAGTVYGGTLDLVSGLLTVDRGIITDFTSLESASSQAPDGLYRWYIRANNVYSGNSTKSISSFAKYKRDFNYGGIRFFGYTNNNINIYLQTNNREEAMSILTDQQLVYELATPQTYQLTPTAVALLAGVNNVFSDAGDTTISYYDSNGTLKTVGPDPVVTITDFIPGTNSLVTIDCDNGKQLNVVVSPTFVSITENGTSIMTQALTMKKNDTLVLAMTPTKWYLKQVTYTGGLLPATDLYPDSTLYPAPVTKQINTWNGTLTYTQEDVIGLTLNGLQTCEYLWLYRDEFSQEIISNLMGGEWYEPSYDAMTLFLATFEESNLYAYVSDGAGETIYGMTIYRREGVNPTLARIADIEPGYTIFRDYSCKSNTPYTYYLYLKGHDTYISAPYESDTIKPGFNFYTLMECRKDSAEPNMYHVLQAFLVSGNLSQSAVSNGNNPNIMENFTRYPLRQSSPHNYKSGVLTTLIGTIDYSVNTYSDTWGLADRLQSLSLTQNTLFLKDMKGALWMIHTNGPISMGVNDKTSVQPIQMSFPWVEIGNAEDVSIVALPTDALWENDEIIDTTVSIDIDTGILSWTYPDVYRGSTLLMNDGGQLIARGTGTVEIADMHIDDDANLIVTE